MSKFKEMKFWIGDDPELSEKVQKLLFATGYAWGDGCKSVRCENGETLYSYDTGRIDWSAGDTVYFDRHVGEEINIDWMRSTKPETIELDGKTYEELMRIKAELEEALRNIKPI